MKREYNLKPYDARNPWLTFAWDPETGEVSGAGAEYIFERIKLAVDYSAGDVPTKPEPSGHTLSKTPLKSKRDMAAILGWNYILPPELLQHYPFPKDRKNDPPNAIY